MTKVENKIVTIVDNCPAHPFVRVLSRYNCVGAGSEYHKTQLDVEGHSSKKWISSSIWLRSHLLHNLLLTSNFKYLPVSIFSLWEDILSLVMALFNVIMVKIVGSVMSDTYVQF
jgi:hypothetical protein